jgi:D-alanyl-D-alanine carboxypeptidase/D-alanyl-D-alanine-endopeptidase (penicillin-binding protein 4)
LFAPFVGVLRNAGVKRVAGDIVADATWFRGVPYGAGWTADDLNDDYGAEVSAIAIEDNYAEIRVAPGAREGAAAEVTIVEPHTGLVLDNRVKTVAKGGTRRIDVTRLIGENVVHIFGEMPLGDKEMITEATVPKPASWFAAALKAELVRAGIAVDGLARSVRWPDAPPDTTAGTKLGDITSPPMRELVAAFMKPSQNLETNMVFSHVGEMSRTAEMPARRTSEELGVGALQEFLKKHGLPAEEVRLEEGSGLSRNNLATANATVALLTYMAKHPEGKAYEAGLPVAGVDGTLRRRMKGTPAEGKVHAKTGTLRYANSLSGYLTTAAGERLVFAAMLNRSIPVLGRPARDDLDELAVMLAGFAGK